MQPISIQQIEIITAFRRLVLIAESHVRLGDLFARGGLNDAEAALRPWRDLVAVDAHLQLPDFSGPMPPTMIEVVGVGRRAAALAHPPALYAAAGLNPIALQGNVAETVFPVGTIVRPRAKSSCG